VTQNQFWERPEQKVQDSVSGNVRIVITISLSSLQRSLAIHWPV
jgi:hypothetical protein